VVTIGRTSFTTRCAASQDGLPVAGVDVVLVSFGYDERTPAMRVSLEQHLCPS
jgi:hypothetical protein